MSNLAHLGGDVFRWVLQTTWQAAVLAGLILTAQWLLRKRLSAGWRYILWLLLVVRLLLPNLPPSAFSIFNLTRTMPTHLVAASPPPGAPVAVWSEPSGVFLPTGPIGANPHEIHLTPAPAAAGPAMKMDWFDLALCGWLAGVCFFGARLIWTNARFRSRIAGYQLIADEAVTRLFNECRAALKITQPVRLIESEEVESPAVYGFWRKWLLLPDGVFERFSTEELRCIFLHELAHIKRRDLGVNWLVALLQVLHWFNPVLWLAFARMRADRELATDALALAHVAGAENVAYGETILKVVENLAHGAVQLGLVGIAENKAGLKARLRAIAQFSAMRPWKWAAVAAAVAVAGVGLTDARQPAAPVVSSAGFTLKEKQLPGITGIIVNPDGRPAGSAQVALLIRESRPTMTGEYTNDSDLYLTGRPRLFNPASGHAMGEPRRVAWNYCTTDANGRFYLDDLEGSLFLLAANEKGIARVSTNEFSRDMAVKLEPWGRIEGSLWKYDQVVTNESVFAAMTDDGTGWSRNTKFETNTDGHGRFLFEYVPPGRFSVGEPGMIDVTTVKSGETAVVKVGGSGRPVVGKFKIRNPYVEIEWGKKGDFYLFSTFVPKPPGGFKSVEDMLAWGKQPEVERALEKVRARPLQCAKDGSFRIDQVDPGTYDLGFMIHDPRQAPGSTKFIAEYEGTFEVPAGKPNTWEPYDLGVIEVSLKTNQLPAHAAAPPESVRPKAATVAVSDPYAQGTGMALMKGSVVLQDGTPAVNARLGYRYPVFDGHGTITIAWPNAAAERADAHGEFELWTPGGADFLYAANKSGATKIGLDRLTNGVKIVLQPWGRVQGVLRSNNRPAPYVSVSLNRDPIGELESTTTDDQGRFVFDHVLEGDYKLIRSVRSIDGENSEGGYPIFFQVRSGETTNLVWGGNGRPVTGKCVGNNEDIPPGGAIDVRLDSPQHFPPFSAGDSTALAAQQQRIMAWLQTDDGKKDGRNHIICDGFVAPDGSFEVDDVPPGTYELNFDYGSRLELRGMAHLIAAPRQIVVPPPSDSDKPKAYDLGDFRIRIILTGQKPFTNILDAMRALHEEGKSAGRAMLKEGDSAPEIETKTFDGRRVRLNDYRGRYVLLDLHLTFSAAETKEVEALNNAYANDDRLVVISLALDKDEDYVKKLQAKGAKNWIVGDLDWFTTARDYGGPNAENPDDCLIDPQGKIVGVYLPGEALQAAVATALARK